MAFLEMLEFLLDLLGFVDKMSSGHTKFTWTAQASLTVLGVVDTIGFVYELPFLMSLPSLLMFASLLFCIGLVVSALFLIRISKDRSSKVV